MILQDIAERRKARKKGSAEDFTPLPLVNEILDRLSKESNDSVWAEDKTFLDPACGNGNFLIEILKRKLAKGHDPLKSLETLYGADIMQDNITECRLRLIKVAAEYIHKHHLPKMDPIMAIKILKRNIKWTPLKNFPNGSLDYDFSFNDTLTDEQAKEIVQKIREEKLLEQVSIE